MSVALRLADRVAETGGPRAGLTAYRLLADKTNDGDVKGLALLAALRCAIALRDYGAVDELTASWPHVPTGLFAKAIGALCKELPLIRATKLADAEIRRHPTAQAFYLYARCLDAAGDPRAARAFSDAVGKAEREGAEGIITASRVRRVVLLARSLATLGEALEEAARLDLAKLSESDRHAVARVMLCSPSRFVRATAISVLDVRSCARHAEDMGERLTPLEMDRLLAVLAVLPEARDALRVADRIDRDADLDAALAAAATRMPRLEEQHTRAREILKGRFEPQRDPTDEPWSLVLDVAAAVRDSAHARAAVALRMLAEREERGAWSPVQVWTIAEVALSSENAEVRGVAGRLAMSRMARGACVPPPRGWLGLATALANAGMSEPAELARRAAVAAKESGAADALVVTLTKAGWELARSGERGRALARLREAKEISSRTTASTPSR